MRKSQGVKLVTDAVHAKGGYMTCQLWHVCHPPLCPPTPHKLETNPNQVGRLAVSVQLGGRQPRSSSVTNIGVNNHLTPIGRVPTEIAEEMTVEDIKNDSRSCTCCRMCD